MGGGGTAVTSMYHLESFHKFMLGNAALQPDETDSDNWAAGGAPAPYTAGDWLRHLVTYATYNDTGVDAELLPGHTVKYRSSNPYGDGRYEYRLDRASAYNPKEALDELRKVGEGEAAGTGQWDILIALIEAVITDTTATTQWAANVEVARAKIDNDIIDDAHIEAEVAEFRDGGALDEYNNSMNRFIGGMASINAVMGSAFIIGMANLEAGFNRDVRSYEARLRTNLENMRLQMINSGATELTRILMAKVMSTVQATQLLVDINKLKIIGYKEQTDTDLQIKVLRKKWPLDVYQYVGNVLAAVSGGVAIPESLTKGQSIMSGVAAGAGIAAPLGPIAAGIGAIAGGIGGAFSQ